MIRKIIGLFNSIILTNIKFLFIKIFKFNRFIFRFNNLISPSNIIEIQDKGRIIFGKKLNIPYGDNCIIGAGTIVKENIHHGTIVIQKREDIIKRMN